MKKILLLLVISALLIVPVLATAPNTPVFTGVPSTDFAGDEKIAGPIYQSVWSGNTVEDLYVTWDSNSIYIGEDGVTGGNSNAIWMSFSKGNGATGSLTAIDPWGTKFSASGWNVDYVYHNYMDGTNPDINYQFSSLTGGANASWNSSVTQYSNGVGNNEIAIPWTLIGLQNSQVVQLVAVIHGGGYDGPSSVPVQTPALVGNGSTDPLNTFMQGVVTDGSGLPVSGAPNVLFSQVLPVAHWDLYK